MKIHFYFYIEVVVKIKPAVKVSGLQERARETNQITDNMIF